MIFKNKSQLRRGWSFFEEYEITRVYNKKERRDPRPVKVAKPIILVVKILSHSLMNYKTQSKGHTFLIISIRHAIIESGMEFFLLGGYSN
jgi:hypothetical protein